MSYTVSLTRVPDQFLIIEEKINEIQIFACVIGDAVLFHAI